MSLLLCRFSDAGMTRLSTRCGGRRPKSAKARSRGKYGTRQCSECYGDRMLVAISMVDVAPARGDVHARMQVSPGECNGHLGGHTEFHQRAVGELMGGIGSRGGKPHGRMLPQLSRFGVNVAKEYF